MLNDVPPIPNDDWMPPLNTIKWRVEFYYTPYMSGGEFWQKEGQALGQGNRSIRRIQLRRSRRRSQRSSVPADTEEQKARKLYDEVMKLDNTDFTREKSSAELKNEKLKQIRNAEDVWTQKSGTSDDLALLYVATGPCRRTARVPHAGRQPRPGNLRSELPLTRPAR